MFGRCGLSVRLAQPDHLLQRARQAREDAGGPLDLAQLRAARLKFGDDVRDGGELAFDRAPDALGLRQDIVQDRLIDSLLGRRPPGRGCLRLEPVGSARRPAPIAPTRLEGRRADTEKGRDVLVVLVGLNIAAAPFGDVLRRNVDPNAHDVFPPRGEGDRSGLSRRGVGAARRVPVARGSLKTQLWSVRLSYPRTDSLSTHIPRKCTKSFIPL